MVVLTDAEIELARKHANELVGKKFTFWCGRDSNLSKDKCIENIFRGKCGEIAARKHLTSFGHAISEVDFKIYDKVQHDADLEIIGSGIQLHVKTCEDDLKSWIFEWEAYYVAKPTSYDFNCFVVQLEFNKYQVYKLKQSVLCKYEATINHMPSKCCVNENTL